MNMQSGSSCSSSAKSCGSQQVNVSEEERLVSVLGGGLMLFALVRYASPLQMAGSVLGAALLYRGLTGHCDLYQAVGISSSEHEEQPRSNAKNKANHRVEEASRESFPASDAPAWTGSREF